MARALHTSSPRADRPFITVNSGSLPADLLESNLFGHVRGAFTGAVYPKKGLFELADKGSIFFDEISTVPVDTQAKLLRVMQEREFMRLGGVIPSRSMCESSRPRTSIYASSWSRHGSERTCTTDCR